MKRLLRTYRLLTPSYMTGTTRLLSGLGSLNRYDIQTNGQQIDADALRSDWEAIGRDMYQALDQFEQQSRTKQSRD